MQIFRLKTDRLLLKPLGTRKCCTTDRLKKQQMPQAIFALKYVASRPFTGRQNALRLTRFYENQKVH